MAEQLHTFNIFGGAFQILAMMILFPVLRKFMNTLKIFYVSFTMAFVGYLTLLGITFTGSSNVYLLLIPAFFIMSAMGMLNVIVTVFWQIRLTTANTRITAGTSQSYSLCRHLW